MSPSFSNKSLTSKRCLSEVLCGISSRFRLLSPTEGQVAHALLTRSPLSHNPQQAVSCASFDLHVLGMPPAFILSQDQTLNKLYLKQPKLHKIDLLKFNLFQNKSQNRILFYTRSSARVLKEPFYFWCLKALLAFFLHCLIFKVQAVSRRFLYITTSTLFCQHLFLSFFKSFLWLMLALTYLPKPLPAKYCQHR